MTIIDALIDLTEDTISIDLKVNLYLILIDVNKLISIQCKLTMLIYVLIKHSISI